MRQEISETSLEELVQEKSFAGTLASQSTVFFKLANRLRSLTADAWSKKHFFQLINEADDLESFLDDYGARYNRTFAYFTELVASIRGFSQAGYSITHLSGRLESYGTAGWIPAEDFKAARSSVSRALEFIHGTLDKMLEAAAQEARALGVEITSESFPEENFQPVAARRRLPRNVGQSEPEDEEQKIAEVATKFLQACEMLRDVAVRRIADEDERRDFFARGCTEEQARVYEATVHNLQSTYDTHIQNTVLESRDARLPELRGHASAALHLLEAVTHLVHFTERHEDEIRSEEAKHRIRQLVRGPEVQDVALNHLLVWADRFLLTGSSVAEDLLPEYTNLQELELDLPPELTLHARPVSLIVGIVNHFGTPVEMEVAGQRANAASILELLVCVGSHPEQHSYVFRGDERPLRDIRLLFESGLGEGGLESLPEALSYLRGER